MKNADVVIIGAGPGGTSAAMELAKSSLSVIIIEKEKLPRYKVCGGGLVFRGRQKLPIDVAEAVDKEFFQVDVHFGKDKMYFSGSRTEPVISMVMRKHFDQFLVDRVRAAGVEVLEDHKLQHMVFLEQILLKTSRGDIQARFVIAADGALSPTAKMAGWRETRKLIPALEMEVAVPLDIFSRLSAHARFDMNAVPGGYGWCFPKNDHLSIGVASTNRAKLNLRQYLKDYQQQLGINETVNQQTYGFQIPISYRLDGFVRNNVFLVGDAAGFADSLTAEGISNAIYSGQLAGRALAISGGDAAQARERYEGWVAEKIIPELDNSQRLSRLLYGNVWLRNLVLNLHGQYCYDLLVDVFTGKRVYPTINGKRLLKSFFTLLIKRKRKSMVHLLIVSLLHGSLVQELTMLC